MEGWKQNIFKLAAHKTFELSSKPENSTPSILKEYQANNNLKYPNQLFQNNTC